MTIKTYGSVGDVSKQIKKLYGSVGGVSKEIKKLYSSVGGVSKLIYAVATGPASVTVTQAGSSSTSTNAIMTVNFDQYTTVEGGVFA